MKQLLRQKDDNKNRDTHAKKNTSITNDFK